MSRRAAAVLWVAAAVSGCGGGPAPLGLQPTPAGSGPLVIWNLEARPLPEIPYPNDLATRADPGSPTGRRLNLSSDAPTAMERKLRRFAGELEGFSTYGTISVSFDAPLDLGNIVIRQRLDDDPANDVMLLVNIDRRSPGFGELVALDFGSGTFPLTLPRLDAYGEADQRSAVENLLLDTTDEDANGNGHLDPGEDTDADGYLDRPNVYPEGGDAVDDLAAFYERVTNTLISRPLMPLAQETRYAVVLTRYLTGARGEPVRSPWPQVNHARQSAALAELPAALERHGLGAEDVAFAWSFTTQGPTRDLEALRAGLYGHGPFARLDREFAPAVALAPVMDGGDDPHRVPAANLQRVIATFGSALDLGMAELGGEGAAAVGASLDNVAYLVLGELEGPNLLADRDGDASADFPADDDEVWELDRTTGRAYYRPHRIPFMCTIPRPDRGRGPPFPVAIYQHGYGSMRLEQIGFSGTIARYGIATCTIDSYGHGLSVGGEYEMLAEKALGAFGLGGVYRHLTPSRARDLTNDGQPDPGADFFTTDLFHTRDMLRQTVLDVMVLVRALRSFDGVRRATQDLDGDGEPELAGDFDGDGRVDLGGPDNDYFTWGTSLGGIVSSVVAGIEPAIVAAAPQAGGGGLLDIPSRSTQGGVIDAAITRALSPLIIGRPTDVPGTVEIVSLVVSGGGQRRLRIAADAAVAAGDRVVLENLRNGERREIYAGEGGGFRLPIPADALSASEKRLRFGLRPGAGEPQRLADTTAVGDPLRLRVYAGASATPKTTVDRFGEDVTFEGLVYPAAAPLVALTWGLGLQRNAPPLRQILSLAQLVVDPADPINYAPHYFRDPLPAPYDPAVQPGANVLVIVTAGDTNVPVATGVSIARAAGVVSLTEIDPRFGKTPNQVLIDNFVLEGLSRLRRFGGKRVVADPEDFSRGVHAPEAPRLRAPLRLQVRTERGLCALRIPLLDPRGQHAFMIPNPQAPFDNDTFMIHMVGRFLASRGTELPDDVCMATASCPWIP